MNTAQQIIAHIDGHMKKYPNTRASDWYVGIAADVRQRLFGDHGVSEAHDVWAHSRAINSAVARAAEKAYHDAGHDGGPGGGDNTTVFVYAYVKSSRTTP
jgi:hypothetical protein